VKQGLVKRLVALEQRHAQAREQHPAFQGGRMGTIHAAILISAALREGGMAGEELAAANGSLDPKRRAELTKALEAARSIAATLKACRPAKESEPTNEVTQWH